MKLIKLAIANLNSVLRIPQLLPFVKKKISLRLQKKSRHFPGNAAVKRKEKPTYFPGRRKNELTIQIEIVKLKG